MKCVKCGYADTSEANFCPICGNEVSNGRDEPEKGLVYEELIENNRSYTQSEVILNLARKPVCKLIFLAGLRITLITQSAILSLKNETKEV